MDENDMVQVIPTAQIDAIMTRLTELQNEQAENRKLIRQLQSDNETLRRAQNQHDRIVSEWKNKMDQTVAEWKNQLQRDQNQHNKEKAEWLDHKRRLEGEIERLQNSASRGLRPSAEHRPCERLRSFIRLGFR